MRILMLSQFYPPVIGGEERHVQALSQTLAAKGHQVSVATIGLTGPPKTEIQGPIRVHHVRTTMQRLPIVFSDPARPYAPPAPDPELVAALRRVIRAERPDVVHAHNWIVNSVLPLRVGSPAALVLTLHDYGHACATKRLMFRGSPCSGPALVKCLSCAGRHYGPALGTLATLATLAPRRIKDRALDAVIAVSTAVAEGNRLAGSKVPFHVIPNFIADSLWEEAGRVSDAPRPAQLPAGPFLLFVGDLSREKGLPVLLDAWSRLSGRPPMVLMGRRCPETPESLPPGVTLLTDCPHDMVMEAFRRCQVAVAPSIWPDPCPTVILEAMAAGCALVTTTIGGIRDIVIDKESGLRVRPGDSGQLSAALQRLLDEPALRGRLGTGGRARAHRFTAGQVVPRIEDVYRSVTRNGARPASRAGTALS